MPWQRFITSKGEPTYVARHSGLRKAAGHAAYVRSNPKSPLGADFGVRLKKSDGKLGMVNITRDLAKLAPGQIVTRSAKR